MQHRITPYINHVTVTTGHCDRSSRSEVRDDVLAALRPWLSDLVQTGMPQAIPVPQLAHYSARGLVEAGALVCTIYGPTGPYRLGAAATADIPLITLGVAQRSRHAGGLWDKMIAHFGAAPGSKPPQTPWCAVALHPGLAAHRDAVKWLGDLERCIAWAWITRNPTLEAI